MYQTPYINTYNPQMSIDRINSQIAELEKLKQQIPPATQPTNLTQNFQIASNGYAMKYVNSLEEVNKEFVVSDTPYFSKDLSVVWIKNSNGEIRTFELNELIQKDEKDLQIEYLQAQIEELKKGSVVNEPDANTNDTTTKSIKDEKPSNVKSNRTTKTKAE